MDTYGRGRIRSGMGILMRMKVTVIKNLLNSHMEFMHDEPLLMHLRHSCALLWVHLAYKFMDLIHTKF